MNGFAKDRVATTLATAPPKTGWMTVHFCTRVFNFGHVCKCGWIGCVGL